MDSSDGLPGRSRNVLAAESRVSRICHADDSVYSSVMTANRSSMATRVSASERGALSEMAAAPALGGDDVGEGGRGPVRGAGLGCEAVGVVADDNRDAVP